MTDKQNVIFNHIMTKAQDYQIYLRKSLDTMFEYCMTFDEDTGTLSLNWHVYMIETSKKRGRAEVRGSKLITSTENGEDCLQSIYEKYEIKLCKFFRYKVDHTKAKEHIRKCLKNKTYWEGWPFPEHQILHE